MAKTDFLKTWEVIDDPSNPNDVPANGTFSIYDDGGDLVVIQYDGFGSAYPSFQNGIHDGGTDEIIAMFSEDQRITMAFSNGSPNYDELDIVVAETSGPSFDVRVPELGEWGAEADPG